MCVCVCVFIQNVFYRVACRAACAGPGATRSVIRGETKIAAAFVQLCSGQKIQAREKHGN